MCLWGSFAELADTIELFIDPKGDLNVPNKSSRKGQCKVHTESHRHTWAWSDPHYWDQFWWKTAPAMLSIIGPLPAPGAVCDILHWLAVLVGNRGNSLRQSRARQSRVSLHWRCKSPCVRWTVEAIWKTLHTPTQLRTQATAFQWQTQRKQQRIAIVIISSF